MKKRSIIITADDFGILPEVNDAVLAGYENGVITSAGLRVTATASSSAMVSASLRPDLAVGLHLVLCEGQATLPRRHIPNLVNSAGRFVGRPLEAAWLYRQGGGLRAELTAEIHAQLEKFLASGLAMTHISGHYHLHLHPTVLSIIKELAGEYPIPALRKPCGKVVQREGRRALPGWQRAIEVGAMRRILGWGRLRAFRFPGPTKVETLSVERPATEYAVIDRLCAAGRGLTEFVCHPGSLLPRYDGTGEAAVVASPAVRRAVEEAGLELLSYRSVGDNFYPGRNPRSYDSAPSPLHELDI